MTRRASRTTATGSPTCSSTSFITIASKLSSAKGRRSCRSPWITLRPRALRADGWEDFLSLLTLPCEDGQRLRRQWAEQVLLPRVARAAGAEIVHSLASIAPVNAGTRAVVTLHDVTFLLRPTFGRLTTWGMGVLVRAAARRADRLITGTAAARDEICAVLG